MKNLVIGSAGQIGSAIRQILDCDGYDIADEKNPGNFYDVIHICIPYSEDFVEIVNEYVNRFEPELIIIHSTVPVGTCEKMGLAEDVVYSPVRGIHPDLERGIRTFLKIFAGEKAKEAALIFQQKGVPCSFATYDNAVRSLEAAKLWDTTQYGWNIVLEKAIHQYCVANGLEFKLVYTLFNETYNKGYEDLGHPEFKKYILKHIPGKIGGHCVNANLDLLHSPISRIIKDLNID